MAHLITDPNAAITSAQAVFEAVALVRGVDPNAKRQLNEVTEQP